MELVTASDFFFTASLALLLSFLFSKLVSYVITDTQTTTITPVQSHQTETRIGFIKPVVQVTTTTANLLTEQHNTTNDTVLLPPTISQDTNVESVSDVVNDFPVSRDETAVKSDDSTDESNDQCVEEIIEENFDTMLVSAMENEHEAKEMDDEEWEWEGIERSENEKTFMDATKIVAEKGYFGNYNDDVAMEFYGLHKVAVEGPCREPQPMPLKLTARAKWNAWQKMGNMSPEVAMERYITLLSHKFPGWMQDTSAGMTESEPTGSEVSASAAPDLSSALSQKQMILTERELIQESGAQELIPLEESVLENNVKK